MHPFDHHRLDTVAADLRRLAAQLDQHRSTLRSAAGAMSWHSPAAGEFALALTGVLGQLARLAGRLEELSVALGEHGRRAAVRAEQLASGLAGIGRAAERLVRPW